MFDKNFDNVNQLNLKKLSKNKKFYKESIGFLKKIFDNKIHHSYTWLGTPVIKTAYDLIVLQEIIFAKKPNIIIETGVARGGSLIFFSSILKMMNTSNAKVIGVDVEFRKHTLNAIKKSKFTNIKLVKGDSASNSTYDKVSKFISKKDKVMVILDSDHTYNHVYGELKIWPQIVTKNQYLCVTDTFIEDFPKDYFNKNNVGDSPSTALKKHKILLNKFKLDIMYSRKAAVSENRDGYFLKVKS